MSYKNDSYIVILDKYGKSSSAAKADLFETYDRLRDLTASGPALGGSGSGKFFSFLTNIARMFGSTAFQPTLGNSSITVPGTSFYSPISGGTGVLPGGTAAFGLSPFAQIPGFPAAGGSAANIPGIIAGGAAPITTTNPIGQLGTIDWNDILQQVSPTGSPASIGGYFAGGAAPIGALATGAGAIGALGGAASGVSAATTPGGGYGRNWVLPAAGVVSGIGGLLTTLGPFFGPFGLAAAAAGSLLNGAGGAILSSFQNVSQRVLANADTILSSRVKNLETTIKQLDAQQDIIKKLLKEDIDGKKKALDQL
jgi:hypothetical protein